MNKADLHATDISESAVSLAGKNAIANKQNVIFHIHDILNNEEPIRDKNNERILFDVIVSNPPYVTLEDKKKMHVNVTGYEPHNALFVPEGSSLLYYKAILDFCKSNLAPGGRIYFEINESLGDKMLALLKNHGFLHKELKKDLSGKDRFVFGVKNSYR